MKALNNFCEDNLFTVHRQYIIA